MNVVYVSVMSTVTVLDCHFVLFFFIASSIRLVNLDLLLPEWFTFNRFVVALQSANNKTTTATLECSAIVGHVGVLLCLGAHPINVSDVDVTVPLSLHNVSIRYGLHSRLGTMSGARRPYSSSFMEVLAALAMLALSIN